VSWGIPSFCKKMAGISFLDLMLAEALASGLAREARRAERPPPDNFYLLPRDPNAWRQIQTACKKENMVIAVEITDNINENCRRVQSLFVDMAREFDSIPFLRAQIGLGNTFDEVSVAIGFVDLFCVCHELCRDALRGQRPEGHGKPIVSYPD